MATTNPFLTSPFDQIINKQALIIGSNVPYFKYHQRGTGRMPMRKALFIGPESTQWGTADTTGRLDRWQKILAAYVAEATALKRKR